VRDSQLQQKRQISSGHLSAQQDDSQHTDMSIEGKKRQRMIDKEKKNE